MTTVWLSSTDPKSNKVFDHEAVGHLSSSSKEKPPHSGFSSHRPLGTVMIMKVTMAAVMTTLLSIYMQNLPYCEFMSCFKNKINAVLGTERRVSHIQVSMAGTEATSVTCQQFLPYVSEEDPNWEEQIEDYAIILHSRKWIDEAHWPPDSMTRSVRCGVKHYTINFAGIVDPEDYWCSVVPLLSSPKMKDYCVPLRSDYIMGAPLSLEDLLEKMSSPNNSSDEWIVFREKNEPALNFTDHEGLFTSRDYAENFALIVFNTSND